MIRKITRRIRSKKEEGLQELKRSKGNRKEERRLSELQKLRSS